MISGKQAIFQHFDNEVMDMPKCCIILIGIGTLIYSRKCGLRIADLKYPERPTKK